jgi:dTDP-4-dehydrorhamnose 3,5-epimerase
MAVIPFEAKETEIAGLFVVEMKQIDDERGVVREFFRNSEFEGSVLPAVGPWAQVNITESRQGAIRGLHGEFMNKFVAVAAGEAYGAYLDARTGSPTYGAVETVTLRPGVGVLVGAGICNGFQATAEGLTQYLYCFDQEWSPTMPGVSVSAIDPELAISWPIDIDVTDRSLLSEKDALLRPFRDL